MFASFNRFEIEMTKAQAQSATHQGACDADVAVLLQNKKIQRQLAAISPETIQQELAEYGAWDKEELKDEKQNQARIIWIAAGNICEGA